jgi:hypothetical protein
MIIVLVYIYTRARATWPNPSLNKKILKINKICLLIMLYEMRITLALKKIPNTK